MGVTTKVLLVTGGTRGVGAATARLAAARGWAVCINYVEDEAAATALAGEIRNRGGVVMAREADVGKEQDVLRLFAETDAGLGSVTAVVCNARAPATGLPIEHLDGDRAARQLETSIFGSLLCVRAAAQRMSARRGSRGGAIVFVSPRPPRADVASLSAEEAAITAAREALTTTLAKQLLPDRIRVNTVRPSAPRTANWSGGLTNRTDRAIHPMAMEVGPYADEAAKQILWLISDEADRTTGAVVEVPHKE